MAKAEAASALPRGAKASGGDGDGDGIRWIRAIDGYGWNVLSSDNMVNILCPRPIQEYKNNMAQQEDIQTREERYVALPDVIYHVI